MRWKENITLLTAEKTNLIGTHFVYILHVHANRGLYTYTGDCFLSCACISYYGAFSGEYVYALSIYTDTNEHVQECTETH